MKPWGTGAEWQTTSPRPSGQSFREIVTVTADDGIVFDAASVCVEEIRKSAGYAGARVIVSAELARARCKTQTALPIGLSDEFANDPSRQALWVAFLKKNALPAVPLTSVVVALRATLQPALGQAESTSLTL